MEPENVNVKCAHEPRPKQKLLDRAREIIRLKHYSIRTERAYLNWMRRYILFHHKRHPQEMGPAEIEAFLTHLAMAGNVARSTQNQAFNALLFLYRAVLGIPVVGGKGMLETLVVRVVVRKTLKLTQLLLIDVVKDIVVRTVHMGVVGLLLQRSRV